MTGGKHVGRASVLLVLLVLAEHADPAGRNAFPSQRTIEAECGVDRRAVREALRLLVEQGHIAAADTSASRRTVSYNLRMEGATPGEKSPAGGNNPGDDGRAGGQGDGQAMSPEPEPEPEPTPQPPTVGFTPAAIAAAAGRIHTQQARDNGTDIRSPAAFAKSHTDRLLADDPDALNRLADRSHRSARAGQHIPIETFALAALGQPHLLLQIPDPADCTTQCVCDGTGLVEPEHGAGWSPCPERLKRLETVA